jgi:hypothetical protein
MAGRALEDATRDELAVLVREYLMAGHLIDRAGMPHVIGALGREGMRDVAIEEWMGASPVYTRRMQRALGFEGDSVETIFKGMQFDIGAPPQFLDFRYVVHDHDRGEFWLDHCGALADVEPMGEEYVVTMCHDIEDPTFDATAIASNPRAQVRPVHRPPREPADRTPVCMWTVVIHDDHEALPVPEQATALALTRAAQQELAPIDPSGPGRHDYSGPLLADQRFEDWSHSALVRIAEEIALQGHLLALSFGEAMRRRVAADDALATSRRQFTGTAGVAAERLARELSLGAGLDDVARLLAVHPAFHPHDYVGIDVDLDLDGRLLLRLPLDSPAIADGGWWSLVSPDHLEPVDAMVRALDPRYRCEALGTGDGTLTAEIVIDDLAAGLADEVALARFSTGVEFRYEDRGTPVELRPTAR